MGADDNISVGESVKMRSRFLAEEQRSVEKMRLLEEEESRISKMKAKLERRKKKEDRKKRDRERMEKGNRELVMGKEMMRGDESFLDLKPLGSSTQKTVGFDKELTKIRNISPVLELQEIEPILSDKNLEERLGFNSSVRLSSFLNHRKARDSSCSSPLSPNDIQSQQVILATPPSNLSRSKSRRKIKRRSDSGGGGDMKQMSTPIRGFDVKQAVKCMLFSNQLSPCEFSLPKEFTSLKLEKIRENKILRAGFDSSPSIHDSAGLKRARDPSDDEHSSPKRRVRSSHRKKEILLQDLCVTKPDKFSKYEKVLHEKCQDGKFSVIVGIVMGNLEVWVSSHGQECSWNQVARFSCDRKLDSPFLIVDTDTIRIKDFHIENKQIKETSFVIIGQNGHFSDSVTSTQTVLVLTEASNISSLVVEKINSRRVILFQNVGKFSRGSLVTYTTDQIELKYIATIEGSTQGVKKLIGSEDMFICFTKSTFYFFNIKSGICVKTLQIDLVGMNCLTIVKAILVMGNINLLHIVDGNMRLVLLKKTGFKILASTPVESEPLESLENNTSCLVSLTSDNLGVLLGTWFCKWNLKKEQAKWEKVVSMEQLDEFLDLV